MDDVEKLVKAGLNGWIDAYLNGKMDSETLAILVIINNLELETISEYFNNTRPLVISCLISKEPFTPEERKETKEKLRRVKDAFNQSDGKNKTDEAEKIVEELFTFILAKYNSSTE